MQNECNAVSNDWQVSDADFRDYAADDSALEVCFMFPHNWPTATLCEFHRLAIPDAGFLRLERSMRCVGCGTRIHFMALRDAKVLIEFLEIMRELAREVRR